MSLLTQEGNDMSELNKIYQPAPEVSVREIEGELLLFHPDHEDLFTMNNLAVEIWKALNEEITVRNIIDKICNQFEIKLNVVEPDVLLFINELAEKGFIELKLESDTLN